MRVRAGPFNQRVGEVRPQVHELGGNSLGGFHALIEGNAKTMSIRYAIKRVRPTGDERWLGADALANIHPEMLDMPRVRGLDCTEEKADRVLFLVKETAHAVRKQMSGRDYPGQFRVVIVR